MSDVFISYAREDERRALEIYQSLVGAGLSVWMDKKDLLPGQDWKYEIEKAIRGSAVFLACLSTLSVDKTGFVQAEMKKALEVAEMMPEGKIFMIPLRLDACEVPYRLRHLQWLDYFQPGSQETLVRAIASKVMPELSQPAEQASGFGTYSRMEQQNDAAPMREAITPVALRSLMDVRYDLETLRVLCFDLKVRYENLRGEGISAKIVSLIETCRRENKYDQLLAKVTGAGW